MRIATALVMLSLLFGCGMPDGACPDTVNDSNTAPDAGDCVQQSAPAAPQGPTMFALRGGVVSAFPVQVDGVAYSDLEEYYTNELMALPDKLNEAGYSGYTMELEAELGFRDLTKNMTVFVRSSNQRGYQGIGYTDEAGVFDVSFPAEASDDYYKIRATKRITLHLTMAETTVDLCFNFSASEKDVSFKDITRPVLLDRYETTMTAYACSSKKEGGIQVPDNNEEDEAPPGEESEPEATPEGAAAEGATAEDTAEQTDGGTNEQE